MFAFSLTLDHMGVKFLKGSVPHISYTYALNVGNFAYSYLPKRGLSHFRNFEYKKYVKNIDAHSSKWCEFGAQVHT